MSFIPSRVVWKDNNGRIDSVEIHIIRQEKFQVTSNYKYPVMLYIHGGGLMVGGLKEETYEQKK